jgi:hypothetical protein
MRGKLGTRSTERLIALQAADVTVGVKGRSFQGYATVAIGMHQHASNEIHDTPMVTHTRA